MTVSSKFKFWKHTHKRYVTHTHKHLTKYKTKPTKIQIIITRKKSHTASMSSTEAGFFQRAHPGETRDES